MESTMEPSSNKNEAAPPNTCSFFQLPYPLILDIFSRLPIDDLFHCRCVCKRFLCFISDAEFACLHFSRSPLCMLVKIDIDGPQYSTRLQLADLDAEGANFQVSKLRFTPESNVPTCNIYGMSACNGLICLLCLLGTKETFYVCNPILGEYITIQPPYSEEAKRRGAFWGFGYPSLTKQYKVLQTYIDNVYWPAERPEIRDIAILSDLAREPERVEIYTIGTGTWRSIGNAPKEYVSLPFNAFLNGIIHWSNLTPRDGEFITSFDFDAELFGTVLPPDHFQELDEESAQYTVTGVLGGCLFIIHFVADSMQFDIWVMKEYGVKESWTKQFVVENLYPKGSGLDFYRYQPMFVLSNGEILMLLKGRAIVCYNQERKQFRELYVARPVYECINAITYTPCFVSLYNVAKGELISRMQSTGVYDKMCKEELLPCSFIR